MGGLEELTLASLASIIWPFCRIGGFCMNMFVFSGAAVPPMARVWFSLMFAVCILPDIPPVENPMALFSLYGALITVKEILIGMALGYLTQFLAQVFIIAGQAVAMQTGLGFASLVDPVSGTNTPVVGQFFSVLTTLVFLAMNGHLLFFRMLEMSFSTLPIGLSFLPLDGMHDLVYFGSTMFLCGLVMAISSICTMLVVNFTLGVMTRAAPQLNIFSLGFAVTMVTGMFVLATSLNAYMINYTHAINEVISTGCTLMGTSCEGIFD